MIAPPGIISCMKTPRMVTRLYARSPRNHGRKTASSGAIVAVWMFAGVAAGGGAPTFQPRRVAAAFPPITNAPFTPSSGARVHPAELVLGVALARESKAYPINMLTGPQREIINDTLGGSAIAATW